MLETAGQSLPTHLAEPLARLAQDMQRVLGEDLLSLVVFGGAARDEHVPKRSDVNLLVVLRRVGPEQLRAVASVLQRARRGIRLAPVLLSREDLEAYRDIFAIELLEMQEHHLTLSGDDPLAGLSIDAEHLRAELQHELRGKLVRLRQSYVRDEGNPRAVAALLAISITSFLTLFGVALRLRGGQPTRKRTELVGQLADAFELDAEMLRRLLAARAGQRPIRKQEAHELFARYLADIESVVLMTESA
jgi:predicted nucleotidyltransferase